ncbi:MAG: ABC transporter substrate-binding protein [Candidatus Enteromonas sp.]
MNSKRILFLLVPALLASCGGNSESTGNSEGPGPSESTSEEIIGNRTLSVLFHVDKNTQEGIAYQKRLDAFNQENAASGLRVVGQFKARTTGVSSYETELVKMKESGTLPDIITFDAPMCAKYAMDEFLFDITSHFTSDELSSFLTTNTYQGRLYGLPIQESSAGFYYNKALFAQAGIDVSGVTVENPWDFGTFKNVCAKLKTAGITPVDLRLDATKDETAPYLLYPFIYAAGGDFLSSDGWTARGYLDGAKTKAGFQFLKDCVDSGYTGYGIGATDFFTGKVGMYLSSGWTIPDLDHKYPSTFPNRDSWGLLPYPKSETAASATGSWCFGVTDNGKTSKTDAVKLLKFLTSADSSATITAATGMISARRDVEGEAGEPETLLRKQLALSGRARPESVGYLSFSQTFNNVIGELKDKSVNDAISSATSQLQSTLDGLKDLYI